MSAPGIRALNMARTLAASIPGADVTLAVPATSVPPESTTFRVSTYNRWSLPNLVRATDVVVAQYVPAYALPFAMGKRLVLDFFANFVAEWLEISAERPQDRTRAARLEADRRYLNLQLSQADLVLVANERQRDLWLGALAATGRVTPETYDADPSLRTLIEVAPFGVRPESAVSSKKVIKGVIPGIGPQDRILIWNGGILHWYDPTTLLQAMALLREPHPEIKLFFLGTKYPVADPIEGQTLSDMLARSDALALSGSTVFFNEGWLPYDETGDFLLEADAGVCTYLDNLETHFAQRVRLIDLIWAERPIVCSRGDEVGEMVAERGFGLTVPPRDPAALAAAIARVLDDAELRAKCVDAMRAAKVELSWERCLRPVIDFCREMPARSPSRSAAGTFRFAASYALGRLALAATSRSN